MAAGLADSIAVRYGASVHRVRFAAAVRPLVRVAGRLLLAAHVLVLALAAAPLAFADTAPPAAAAESNTVLLGVVALGALLAILVLNRPRKPGSR